MAGITWGAVKGFDPALTQSVQGGLAARLAGLTVFQGKLQAASQLPGWDGDAKDTASSSFGGPVRYLAEAASAATQARAKVGEFGDALSALKDKAQEVEAKGAQAGFTIGADGSIRDFYGESGLADSLSATDKARYAQVKAQLPGDVASVLAAANAASAQAVTGLGAAGKLTAVSPFGARTDAGATSRSGDLTLYVEGPYQVYDLNHDWNYQQVLDLINSAKTSVDVTVAELDDPAMRDALVAAAARGVKVRVILNRVGDRTLNQPTLDYLNAHGVQTVWGDDHYFRFFHQKTVTVDGTTSAVMTGNLTAKSYPTSRDYTVIDKDKNDIAAIQDVFNHDFDHTSDPQSHSYSPPNGDNLVWPGVSTADDPVLDVINSAQHTLNIENEELAAQGTMMSAVSDSLVVAAQRGVDVNVTMSDNPAYYADFDKLAAGGVHVHLYPNTADGLAIHGNNVVADNSTALVGSVDFSEVSMLDNRELAIKTNDTGVVSALTVQDNNDYADSDSYKPSMTAPAS